MTSKKSDDEDERTMLVQSTRAILRAVERDLDDNEDDGFSPSSSPRKGSIMLRAVPELNRYRTKLTGWSDSTSPPKHAGPLRRSQSGEDDDLIRRSAEMDAHEVQLSSSAPKDFFPRVELRGSDKAASSGAPQSLPATTRPVMQVGPGSAPHKLAPVALSQPVAPMPAKAAGGPKPCKNGVMCKNPQCKMDHPAGRDLRAVKECKNGAYCTNRQCKFSHPPERVLPEKGTTAAPKSVGSQASPPTTPPTQRKQRSNSTSQNPAPAPGPAAKKVNKPAPQTGGKQQQQQRGKRKPELKRQMSLFSHLPQAEISDALSLRIGFAPQKQLHPAILELGLQYTDGTLTGANARCLGMLQAFRNIIADYQCPRDAAFHRDLDSYLKPQIQYLVDCRPLAIGMRNAINFVKAQIAATAGKTEEESKQYLADQIATYTKTRITLAIQNIVEYGVQEIRDGDVVLTFASSSSVLAVLKAARVKQIDTAKRIAAGEKCPPFNFRVIVVDARPKKEGKEFLRRLVADGIECTYTTVNAVSYVMTQATKVILGAHAMFSNGTLFSRTGTALIALMAREHHIPAIVCCETYKFTERVTLEPFSFNELADPSELAAGGENSLASSFAELDNLTLLNLVYDVTPANLISMLITENGVIPPSSVPVILREYRQENWATDLQL